MNEYFSLLLPVNKINTGIPCDLLLFIIILGLFVRSRYELEAVSWRHGTLNKGVFDVRKITIPNLI